MRRSKMSLHGSRELPIAHIVAHLVMQGKPFSVRRLLRLSLKYVRSRDETSIIWALPVRTECAKDIQPQPELKGTNVRYSVWSSPSMNQAPGGPGRQYQCFMPLSALRSMHLAPVAGLTRLCSLIPPNILPGGRKPRRTQWRRATCKHWHGEIHLAPRTVAQ